MKLRDKSPGTKELIIKLDKAGKKSAVWKSVAKSLNRPRRKAFEVSLSQLEKHGEATVVVPGKVLGTGSLTRPMTVAALGFSEKARSAITKSGGKAIPIASLLEEHPKMKKIRIIG